jgi:hypothetical protein
MIRAQDLRLGLNCLAPPPFPPFFRSPPPSVVPTICNSSFVMCLLRGSVAVYQVPAENGRAYELVVPLFPLGRLAAIAVLQRKIQPVAVLLIYA